MKYRELALSTGTRIFLGRDAESNDELVWNFKGKDNMILHTAKPGSPFCVIEKLDPSAKEVKASSIICAVKSQDWRDNKQDVDVHVFNGKVVDKPKEMKPGTWGLKAKPKVIKVKKQEIEEWIKKSKEEID